MDIVLDIDDTITYAPEFFRKFVERFPEATITIVSFRTDREQTEAYLSCLPIRYERLILSSDAELGKAVGQTLNEWKANLVNTLNPDIFFEDMPEVVGLIDPAIIVFMPCDDTIREWLRSAL